MSPICEERPFQKAVVSWNSSTPEGSSVEIQLRIWRQGEGGEQPSQWYSWGMWGAHIDRKSRSITEEEAPDEGISMDTDTLSLSGRKALRFQFRVLFIGEKESPSLYLLGLTVPVEKPEGDMNAAGLVPWPQNLPFRAETEVPACSQLLRDPVFARELVLFYSYGRGTGLSGLGGLSSSRRAPVGAGGWAAGGCQRPVFQ